jgi:hypothetical protein
MNFKVTTAFIALLFLVGCGSAYTYHVDPTPIKKGITKYTLGNVDVNITLGHGGKSDDERFANQQQLTDNFKTALDEQLKEHGLFAANGDGTKLDLSIQYHRNFFWGGNSLHKPEVSYQATARNDQLKLASFSKSGITTQYGTFEDMAVNVKIASGNWGAEGELRDVQQIATSIITELANMGE